MHIGNPSHEIVVHGIIAEDAVEAAMLAVNDIVGTIRISSIDKFVSLESDPQFANVYLGVDGR
jgi:hypothetical protein